MPTKFRLSDLEYKKIELEKQLKLLETNELDEISDEEEYIDIEEDIDKEEDSDKEEGSDKDYSDKEEIKNDTDTENDSETEEDEISKKVNSIIDKRKLNKYMKVINNILHFFENYMEERMDELDSKNIITKKDSFNFNKEYRSNLDVFYSEYDNITDSMPIELDFTNTYIKNINKRLSSLDDDVNEYLLLV